ncbi:type II toxin-antitoxin system YafQ family toxin [Patescibacteria group bacterium]|nr:type II toxin-antitoxin system YafQ family toxin [Patescibacteria group bacterium]MBU4481913.1 type II toxin-antitoxin system YafQ family toxin [Patescibacteria group bacterium]
MLTIHPNSRFKRSFKKQPDYIREDFAKKIEIFKKNPFSSSLHTHKLSGNLDDYYSFYLKDGFRVLFDFEKYDIVILVNIGSHDDYRKWSR